MDWVKVVSLPIEKDLTPVCQYLHQQRVVHRVTEEQGQQVIWVTDRQMAQPVAELMERWLKGEVNFEMREQPGALTGAESRIAAADPAQNPFYWRRIPWTLLLLVLSIIGFILVSLDPELRLVRWLTFQDLVRGEEYIGFRPLGYSLVTGQWWRLVTPIFLHFSIFHVLFNGLWLWEFGRRIEALNGGAGLMRLVLLSAMFSNMVQYLWQGASLFGGMSGVIYALLGYIWMRQRRHPHPYLAVPPGIIGFMLAWLVIAMSGAVTLFSNVQIANGAHLGGLVIGMLSGILSARRASGN